MKASSISWNQDDRKPNKEVSNTILYYLLVFANFYLFILLLLFQNNEPQIARNAKDILFSISLVAERLGCSLVQLSIAWTLKNESVQCLLLGAATTHQFYHALHGLQVNKVIEKTCILYLKKIIYSKMLL